MGFLNKFDKMGNKAAEKVDEVRDKTKNHHRKLKDRKDVKELDDDYKEYFEENDYDTNQASYEDSDVNIRPAQKSESFFHFILENQYQDIERSVRGYKDVYSKETGQWEVKRKDVHCFTDEEAEDILRTAQSHLATDIKLAFVSVEDFPIMMDTLYKQFVFLFRRIAEYRYGRYKSYELQGKMKEQNFKIFIELYSRIRANYSRSIQGKENQYTHDSVRSQESLQSTDSINEKNKGYY